MAKTTACVVGGLGANTLHAELLVGGTPGPKGMVLKNQHALVIGNDSYQHNARLSNGGNDAKLVASVMAASGAEVDLLLDANRDSFRQNVVLVAKKAAQAKSMVWFYYSGHGVQLDGLNYLQGVDADFSSPLNVKSYGVEVSWVADILNREGVPLAVLMIDACRNNPFVPETRGMDGQGLAPMFQSQGVLVAFSTAPFKKALDGKGQPNGPYAQALAAVLQKRPLALEDAFKSVADEVYTRTAAAQMPWYQSSLRAQVTLQSDSVEVMARPGLRAMGRGTALPAQYRPDQTARLSRRAPGYWLQAQHDLQLKLDGLPFEQKLQALETLATQGDGAARFQWAVAQLEQGNYGESFKWLTASVQEGHPEALQVLQRSGLVKLP